MFTDLLEILKPACTIICTEYCICDISRERINAQTIYCIIIWRTTIKVTDVFVITKLSEGNGIIEAKLISKPVQ